MGILFGETLQDYKSAFEKFKNYINKIHNDSSGQNKVHQGYLVYLNEYDEFKKFVEDSIHIEQQRQNSQPNPYQNQVNDPI